MLACLLAWQTAGADAHASTCRDPHGNASQHRNVQAMSPAFATCTRLLVALQQGMRSCNFVSPPELMVVCIVQGHSAVRIGKGNMSCQGMQVMVDPYAVHAKGCSLFSSLFSMCRTSAAHVFRVWREPEAFRSGEFEWKLTNLDWLGKLTNPTTHGGHGLPHITLPWV